MKSNQAQYAISTQCRTLGVSASGYYAWATREPSAHKLADLALGDRIGTNWRRSRKTYGRPRIQADLRDEGIHVSDKRVARLKRDRSIRGASRRKGFTTTIRDRDARPAPDLVEREFAATEQDQLWVADITYVPTLNGFLFVAIVLDVFSRRVVGWSMATHLHTDLVLAALNMAIENRRPKNAIHHSDHGCQYTSIAFGSRCKEAGIRPSMGSVGDYYDNAMCERSNATLECELLVQQGFKNSREAAPRGLRLHRGLLQSAPSAYGDRFFLSTEFERRTRRLLMSTIVYGIRPAS